MTDPPATSRAFVVRCPTRLFTQLGVAMMLCALGMGQNHSADKFTDLALLSGTPTNYGPVSYPVNLYQIDANRRLKLVREIVSAKDGLYSVRDDLEGTLWIAFPHVIPTRVSLIHAGQPTVKDEVEFNHKAQIVLNSRAALAAADHLGSRELFPIAPQDTNSSSDPTLVGVLNDQSVKNRLLSDDWSDYQGLRFAGVGGGPQPDFTPMATLSGGKLAMVIGAQRIVLQSTPSAVPSSKISSTVAILASTDRFLVFNIAPAVEELSSGKIIDTRTFIYDRKLNSWKHLDIPSNSPRTRIFGFWMVTTVENWKPDNADNPGRTNERNFATTLLPNVREEYSVLEGANNYIPGTLILDNLESGKRAVLQTNQEDSEVLMIQQDLILYRINDEIFEGQIVGEKVINASLLVKDADVPEIHWTFMAQH